MDETLKNGAPDLWVGSRLYEVKRGPDRLKEHQIYWHQHYYAAHGEWVRIAFFPDAKSDSGCIFPSYLEFEQALSDLTRVKTFKTPILSAIFKGEYSRLEIKEELHEITEIQTERFVPTPDARIFGRRDNEQKQHSAGASGSSHISFRER